MMLFQKKEWLTLPEDPTVDLDRGSRPRTTKSVLNGR